MCVSDNRGLGLSAWAETTFSIHKALKRWNICLDTTDLGVAGIAHFQPTAVGVKFPAKIIGVLVWALQSGWMYKNYMTIESFFFTLCWSYWNNVMINQITKVKIINWLNCVFPRREHDCICTAVILSISGFTSCFISWLPLKCNFSEHLSLLGTTTV